jgi:hypothetical protein
VPTDPDPDRIRDRAAYADLDDHQQDLGVWADGSGSTALPAAVDVHTVPAPLLIDDDWEDRLPVDPADCQACRTLPVGQPCFDHYYLGWYDAE